MNPTSNLTALPAIAVSISGGKDSTATALLALQQTAADRRFIFADTGNEHELTHEYIHTYLPSRLGIRIDVVRADFSADIARKRKYISEYWPAKGVPAAAIERALAILQPTGVPFLDLCLWKGRFPSRMAQFCTQELKRRPLDDYLLQLFTKHRRVESWRGIRREESRTRQSTPTREMAAEGWEIVCPIVEWTGQQVVSFVRGQGVDLNPLYRLGMKRVGCMPCINCGKDELAQIAARFPGHIDKIREWEHLVGQAAKRGVTTFFTDAMLDGETDAELFARLNIDARVAWSRTARGGRQLSLLKAEVPAPCSSVYGLCE
jgi:3'-phosphoadenosine 5'-phosphosulfate sulfotransferase (PAPS reductase)/FAD synthetase